MKTVYSEPKQDIIQNNKYRAVTYDSSISENELDKN